MLYYEVPKGVFIGTAIETIRKIAKEKSEVVIPQNRKEDVDNE